MSVNFEAIRTPIDARAYGGDPISVLRDPHAECVAAPRPLPSARTSALAGALARSLTAMEQRNTELESRLQHAGIELARALHGLALGHAVLRRLDLPPEARAVVLQQNRGYEAALAALDSLRAASPEAGAAKAGGEDAMAAERAAQLPPTCRVLVIDDDAAVRLATRLLLEMLGLEVRVAAGRDDALASVATEMPDVVVADCHLAPADTGDAVLRGLEARCARPLPAVLVSGDLQVPPRLDGRVVLQKPFRVDALLAAMCAAWSTTLSSASPVPAPAPAPSARAAW